VNNAVARVAGLVGVSAVGAVVAGSIGTATLAPNAASVHAFHLAMGICAALVAAGWLIAAAGIVNLPRVVEAEGCAGGQLAGAPLAAGASPGPPPA